MNLDPNQLAKLIDRKEMSLNLKFDGRAMSWLSVLCEQFDFKR